MTDISVATTSYQTDDRRWLLSPHGTEPGTNPGITLDVSAFTANVHYPNGYIPSGTPMGRITASGLYGPYAGSNEEVQTVTVTGSPGGGDFTLTFDGQTTAAIAYNAAAAAVQAALVALSNVASGDVTVTGNAGGPYTLTFGGAYADTDVPQLTANGAGLTGGTSPGVTVATTTVGGTDAAATGLGDCAGLLVSAVKVPNLADTTKDAGGALLVHGFVKLSRLPFPLDAPGRANLPMIHFEA